MHDQIAGGVVKREPIDRYKDLKGVPHWPDRTRERFEPHLLKHDALSHHSHHDTLGGPTETHHLPDHPTGPDVDDLRQVQIVSQPILFVDEVCPIVYDTWDPDLHHGVDDLGPADRSQYDTSVLEMVVVHRDYLVAVVRVSVKPPYPPEIDYANLGLLVDTNELGQPQVRLEAVPQSLHGFLYRGEREILRSLSYDDAFDWHHLKEVVDWRCLFWLPLNYD